MLYYPFGNSTAELLIPAAATYVAMLRLRQHATTLAWLVTFSFLLYWYSVASILCPCCNASSLADNWAGITVSATSQYVCEALDLPRLQHANLIESPQPPKRVKTWA